MHHFHILERHIVCQVLPEDKINTTIANATNDVKRSVLLHNQNQQMLLPVNRKVQDYLDRVDIRSRNLHCDNIENESNAEIAKIKINSRFKSHASIKVSNQKYIYT